MRIAIVGGGWAGLAAAVEATSLGHAVNLFEMSPATGGRARRIEALAEHDAGFAIDNGQHILIGAYTESLRLMQLVGVDIEAWLQRMPLTLLDVRGHGLQLPAGAPLVAFVRGVLAARGWSVGERLALLRTAVAWRLAGFRCEASLTVAQLTEHLPSRLRSSFIDPLCVAALNTPAEAASAQVFLRVLRDALFAGPGSADLLLPRVDLGALWPDAACAWLQARGARLHLRQRVEQVLSTEGRWALVGPDVDTEPVDALIFACTSTQAAKLAQAHAPSWSAVASALPQEPIVTVLVRAPGARLPQAMLALKCDTAGAAPAQFVFDLGQLRDAVREPHAAGCLAFVISGAASAVGRGLDATAQAVLAQARDQLAAWLPTPPAVLHVIAEKRATLLCTPGLLRPAMRISPGLLAAGDYVEGPYPSTLEGAVRSAVAAVAALPAAPGSGSIRAG